MNDGDAAPRQGPDRGRLLLALLLTPLLAPFYSAILFARPWDIPFGLISSCCGVLLPGVPVASWLLRHRRMNPWIYGLLGAVCSLPGMLIYAWFPKSTHLQEFDLGSAAAIAGWGVVSGVSFWLIGIAGESPLTLRSLFDMGPPEPPK